MNCKPGDLAVIFRCCYPRNVGKLVQVIDSHRCSTGEWRIKALGELDTNYGDTVRAGQICWADDCDLKPIRDPGEDAKDEMLRPLPKELEHA